MKRTKDFIKEEPRSESIDLDSRVMSKERHGRWTKQEHISFIKSNLLLQLAIQKHGKNWNAIQRDIPNRAIANIRAHAQKFFLKVGYAKPKDIDAISYIKVTPIKQLLNLPTGNQVQKGKIIASNMPDNDLLNELDIEEE